MISEYVGGGVLAEVASTRDEIAREREKAARIRRDAQIEDERQLDSEIIELMTEAKAIIDIFMIALGYKQSNRAWRRTSMSEMRTERVGVEAERGFTREEILELRERIDSAAPSAEDVLELRKIFESDPTNTIELMGMTTIVRDRQLKSLSDIRTMRMAFEVEINEMRQGLGYFESSKVEQMIIEVMICAWLRLQKLESILAVIQDEDWIDRYEKRVSAAQSRLLRATESLTRVRRAMHGLPMIGQLNIALLQQNNSE